MRFYITNRSELKRWMKNLFLGVFSLFASVLTKAQDVNLLPQSFITPPSASQDGSANLNYPIALPEGLNGLTPTLSIHYNSSAGNSWIGLGWNIGLSAIYLDTRWGVPRFDPTKESELYNLYGEQLMYPGKFLPHRHEVIEGENGPLYSTVAQDRSAFLEGSGNTAVKVFLPRRKETYAKIERIGNSPANYYWKVTNMDGSISWFGGDEEGLDNNYVTKTGSNIAFWALKKRVDTHGYFIKYEYQTGTTPTGNLTGGKHLYLKKITYTGLQKINNGVVQILKQPMYEVVFTLDNGTRLDKSVSARYGYKDVIVNRLSDIKVQELFGTNELIRKYALTYSTGAYGKSLLKKIEEYKGNSETVFSHEFAYNGYPKTNGRFVYSSVSTPNINTNMTLGLDDPLNISALGTTENSGVGGELNISGGAGIAWQNMSPGGTFLNIPLYDLKANFTSGKVTMADINGDGLQDIVYKDNNGILRFYPNNCTNCGNNFKIIYNPASNISYGSPKELIGVNHFLKGEGEQRAGLINGLFGYSMEYLFAKFGVRNYKSKSRISHYMTDANGDMLPDFVVKNDDTSLVYFNHLDGNGKPTFTTSSQPTENMLIVADIIQPEGDAGGEYEGGEDEPEMEYDVVKVYSYDRSHQLKFFTVNVSLDNPNELEVGEEVKVSIEAFDEEPTATPGHRQIFSGILTRNNPSLTFYTNSNQHDISLNRYQYFYRTHYSDKNPRVNWDVDYGYTDCGSLDGNSGHCNEILKLEDNFFLSNNGGYPMKFTGNGNITWNAISLPTPTSDDLYMQIIKKTYNQNGEVVNEQNVYNPSMIFHGSTSIPAGNINFSATFNYDQQTGEMIYDELEFKLLSYTNLKWHEIDWTPKITYLGTINNSGENQTISGEKYVIPQHSLYHKEYNEQGQLIDNINGRTIYFNNTSLVNHTNNGAVTLYKIGNGYNFNESIDGTIYITVKQNGQFYDRLTLNITDGIVTFSGATVITLIPGFEYSVILSARTDLNEDSPDILKKFIETHADVNYLFFKTMNGVLPTANFISQVGSTYRGPNYIGGGQFFYNPELASSTTPVDSDGDKLIDISAVNSSSLTTAILSIIDGVGDPEDYETPEEYEQAILDALGLSEDNPIETGEIEDYLTGLGVTDIDDLWQVLGGMNQCILPATPFRKKEGNDFIDRWIGFHEDMYVDKTSAKAGKFDVVNGPFNDTGIGEEEPEEYPAQQADLETGMSAISLYGKGKYKSKRLFVWSESKGHNEYSTRFLDLNGDRYPEIINNNKIYYTTMTGGQKNAVTSSTVNSPLEWIESDVDGVSFSRSFNSSDISNLISSVENAKNGWVSEKGDQNNASARVGLSLDDMDGNNRQEELWMDINGDGFTDWIVNEGGSYKIHYSLGQTMDTNAVTVNSGYVAPNSTPRGSVGVNIGGGFGGILSNMGNGANLGGIVDVSIGGSFAQSDVKAQFVDINNDGLLDLVYNQEGITMVKYNLGNAFTAGAELANTSIFSDFDLSSVSKDASAAGNITVGIVISWNFMIWVIPAYVKVGAWLMFNGNITASEIAKTFKDINGDGFVDMLIETDNGFKVYNSNLGDVNLLSSVNNSIQNRTEQQGGYGGTNYFKLNYIPVGNTYDMPFSKWVLNYVGVETVGQYSELEDYTSLNQYFEYKGGRYDRREREFYGFEWVKSYSSPQDLYEASEMSESAFRATIEGETISRFHNRSYYFKGKPKEKYVIKGDYTGTTPHLLPTNRIFSKEEHFYLLKDVSPEGLIDMNTNLAENFDVGGTEGRGTAAAVLDKTVTKLYEYGSSPITTTTEYVFDEYKRLQSQKNVEENILQEFYYPDELLSEPFMQDLLDNFRMGSPVKSETKEGGVTLVTQSSGFDNNTSTQNQLRAVSSSSSKGSNPLEIKSTIDKYDDGGHILQQSVPGGKPTSVIWGYNDRYPVVTIEGLGYDQLPASIVSQIRSISSTSPGDETALLAKINELRTHSTVSGKALITAYTYYPNTGVRTAVSSNGLKTQYSYYPNGKLKEVIDSNGKTVQKFDYYYSN